MTDPITRFDDGDERYDRAKDDALEAAHERRIASLTREQIECLYEQAEAQYDRELGWDAERAALKMLETDDPAAFKAAREIVAECQRRRDARYDRWAAACAAWKQIRSKP